MQQRFCSCGWSVWVHYLFVGRLWQAVFADAAGRGQRQCSHCGSPLSIHDLR